MFCLQDDGLSGSSFVLPLVISVFESVDSFLISHTIRYVIPLLRHPFGEEVFPLVQAYTPFESDGPSSDMDTVDRVALDVAGSLRLNHSLFSTLLKPFIVRKTLIMSPRARRSVRVVSPMFSSRSS